MQWHAHIEHAKKCINSKGDYNAFTNTFFITIFKKISILNLTQETTLLSAHKIPKLRKLIKPKKYLIHLNFL